MSTCVVKPGQGPWQVAEEHLGDGSRWREIMRLNGLKDDHILHPGDVLQLPPRHKPSEPSNPPINNPVVTEKQFTDAVVSNSYPNPTGKYAGFLQACEFAEIVSKTEAAMFLAQLIHESGGLVYTKESFTLPISAPHYNQYIGRGYIQLSTEGNYREASRALGYDYVIDPDLVCQDPHAWLVSGWYWKTRVKSFVPHGFDATTTNGLAPLLPNHERRREIHVK